MSGKYQSTTGTFTHADGAIMTYDILGTQHLNASGSNQVPIVLAGGMSSLRGDWDRLATGLSEIRPVLLFDHRGMGDSTFSPQGDERITIELYARDLLDLLIYLQWKRIALCGFSMGGAVVQQLLLLPYHTLTPTPPHPFTITHVFLTGTFTTPIRQSLLFQTYQSIPPPPANGKQRTKDEKKNIVRSTLELTFDEDWLSDPRNHERLDVLLERLIDGRRRPIKTIFQQGRAVGKLNFNTPQSFIPPTIPILVIHGETDQVIPFSSGKEILSFIPHAQFISVGPNQGQVPNLKFGHHLFEYFDIRVWVDVFETFMREQRKFETRL